MALHALIKVMPILIFILGTSSIFASDFTCKEVVLKSQTVKGVETSTLCFLKDDTYFLSNSCADLQCEFIDRLKKIKTEHNQKERPGTTLCKALKGMTEVVTLPGSTLKIQRCLFSDEKTSISLNLLESWNGKKFSGPANSLKL